MKTEERTDAQLGGAVREFCSVLDQVPVAFFWESHYESLIRPEARESDLIQPLRNATLESSLLAIRIINDFFASGGYPTDITARHYNGFASPGEFLSPTEREDTNKDLAHLTIQRVEGFPKPWQLYDLIVRAHRVAETFLTFLTTDPARRY